MKKIFTWKLIALFAFTIPLLFATFTMPTVTQVHAQSYNTPPLGYIPSENNSDYRPNCGECADDLANYTYTIQGAIRFTTPNSTNASCPPNKLSCAPQPVAAPTAPFSEGPVAYGLVISNISVIVTTTAQVGAKGITNFVSQAILTYTTNLPVQTGDAYYTTGIGLGIKGVGGWAVDSGTPTNHVYVMNNLQPNTTYAVQDISMSYQYINPGSLVVCGIQGNGNDNNGNVKSNTPIVCQLNQAAQNAGMSVNNGDYSGWYIDTGDSGPIALYCGGPGGILTGVSKWGKNNQLDSGYCNSINLPSNIYLGGPMLVQGNYGDTYCPPDSIATGGLDAPGKNDSWSGFYCSTVFYRINGNVDTYRATNISGWAFDPGYPSSALDIQVYIDGNFYDIGNTNVQRNDVNNIYGTSGDHGFSWAPPLMYQDGNYHSVTVYAYNPANGNSAIIGNGGFTSTPSTGGTVNVTSVNSVTGQPVAALWSAFGPSGDLCGSNPCSNSGQSFENAPLGSYGITPYAAVDPAGSYAYNTVSPVPSAPLVNPGDTANFAIEWDPVAVLSVSSPSVTLTSASPSQSVSALDTGTVGSSITLTGYTLNPSSASSYITVGLPSGPISSLTGHAPSSNWLAPSAYAAGGGPVTVTINPATAPASCFVGAGCPVTVTLNGTSLPSNPANAALQTSFNVATTLTGISVGIIPSSATMSPGGTQQFTATVVNDAANRGVRWSASQGTIAATSASGAPVTYTAPASPAPGPITITATSISDATKSITATVTITNPLTIMPNPPGPIPVGVPAPFSCSGGNGSCYTWTSDGVAASGCGPSFQQTFNAPGVYPVTCTDSNGTTASTTVTITPDCTLTASPASIVPPEQSTLSWSCVPGTANSCNITDASGGSVVANGATSSTVAVAPNTNQTYTLSCIANNGLGSTIPSVSAKVMVQGPNIQETH